METLVKINQEELLDSIHKLLERKDQANHQITASAKIYK